MHANGLPGTIQKSGTKSTLRSSASEKQYQAYTGKYENLGRQCKARQPTRALNGN